MKIIKFYLAGEIVPYTEISGNRPALFNINRTTSIRDFKDYVESFKNQFNFVLVENGKYQFKRDNLINATINIDSRQYDRLDYNYAIVEIDDEAPLLFYITKIITLQNNVNKLFLKLDSVSSYFWKIPLDKIVEVDRLNYNITATKNYDLLRQTLKVEDNTIGNIIKDRKILHKFKTTPKLNLYSYKKFTSNEIDRIKNLQIKDLQDGFLNIKSLYYYKKEDSFSTYYNILNPLKYPYYIITNDRFFRVFGIKSVNEFKLSDHREDGSSLLYINIDFLSDTIGKRHIIENLKINVRIDGDEFLKKYLPEYLFSVFDDTLINKIQNIFFENSFISLNYYLNEYMTDKSKKDIFFIIFPIQYINQSFSLPKIFKYIPPINELVDFNFIMWNGILVPFNRFNLNHNLKLNFKFSSYFTTFQDKNYLLFEDGIDNISHSFINNINELEGSKSAPFRMDSKVEYLAANQNQIEKEKKVARDNAIFGTINGVLGAGANIGKAVGKGLSGDIGGAVGAGFSATSSLVSGVQSIVNYQNKIGIINSKIQDMGNIRSKYVGGETGDFHIVNRENNLKYFNENGMNYLITLPSGELYKRLKYHYLKFGCRLLSYLTLNKCFEAIGKSKFAYLKLNDMSQLFLTTQIPQEALYYIQDILQSGIHFWKQYKNKWLLPEFNIESDRYSASKSEWYEGVENVKETKTIEI